MIHKINNMAKDKIRKYKSEHPIGKIKSGYKGAKYKEYKNKRKLDLKEIQLIMINLFLISGILLLWIL